MNKIIIPILFIMVISMGACRSSVSESDKNSSKDSMTRRSSVKIFNGKIPKEEIGKGIFYCSNGKSISENGNELITLDRSKELISTPLNISISGADDKHVTYIYIDDVLERKESLGPKPITLDLKGRTLNKGEHTINLIQFDNDSENGNIILNKFTKYEVRKKE